MPEDARVLAWSTLRRLDKDIDGMLKKNGTLDEYTRAHLEESHARLKKALDAAFSHPG
jgi:hypothetical protein